jgi:putative NADH-flavin reductase
MEVTLEIQARHRKMMARTPPGGHMKIVVFGATGGTGLELVAQALDQGHRVTAPVRSPEKLADLEHQELVVTRANVLDQPDVDHAVEGQEAVLCLIGAGAGQTTLREDGTRNIIASMEKAGVARLICLSSLGVGDSRTNLPFFTKYVIVGIFLRHAFADHERQEAIVRKSPLAWTIVRPPHLKDGPRTGEYRCGFSPTDRTIQGKISRADVADFMLNQLTDDTYLRQTPGISY